MYFKDQGPTANDPSADSPDGQLGQWGNSGGDSGSQTEEKGQQEQLGKLEVQLPAYSQMRTEELEHLKRGLSSTARAKFEMAPSRSPRS